MVTYIKTRDRDYSVTYFCFKKILHLKNLENKSLLLFLIWHGLMDGLVLNKNKLLTVNTKVGHILVDCQQMSYEIKALVSKIVGNRLFAKTTCFIFHMGNLIELT